MFLREIMALFFNVNLLEKLAAYDDTKLLYLLHYHYTGRVARSNKSKYKPSNVSLNGYSFLINPKPVLDIDTSIDHRYIAQYIKLAGRRDYLLYKLHGVTSLYKSYFPDLQENNLKTNPLLTITQTEIKFKFEENHGTKVRTNKGQSS